MSWKRRISAAAAAALLFTGLTNAHAHVHLCFDGSEPPATVHWSLGETTLQRHSLEHDFAHAHDALRAAVTADTAHADVSGARHSLADQDPVTEHNDVDLEVASSVIAKTVKHDALCGAFVALQAALTPPRGAEPLRAAAELRPAEPAYRRPPARAPPFTRT